MCHTVRAYACMINGVISCVLCWVLLFDECHHVPCNKYTRALQACDLNHSAAQLRIDQYALSGANVACTYSYLG